MSQFKNYQTFWYSQILKPYSILSVLFTSTYLWFFLYSQGSIQIGKITCGTIIGFFILCLINGTYIRWYPGNRCAHKNQYLLFYLFKAFDITSRSVTNLVFSDRTYIKYRFFNLFFYFVPNGIIRFYYMEALTTKRGDSFKASVNIMNGDS